VRTIVAADVGGTHARFALAEIDSGRAVSVQEPVKLKTAEHASLHFAWEQFARVLGGPLPNELALAFAGPVGEDVLKLTNNPWVIRPDQLLEQLGLRRFTIVNDFGAVGHAVATLGDEHFQHICGPDRPLPDDGVISVVGPGTGLGVACVLRGGDRYEVIETEGGHVDFAPLDPLEDRILAHLRGKFGRVSVERIASGQGLWNIYEALGAIGGGDVINPDERALWTAALEGQDSVATAALDRLCMTLGSVAGDMALAQGASAVVIAGGVGFRLAGHLPRSGFSDRFVAKGRFERRMAEMPVKLITHPEPGLFGAAAAFVREHP
jgi:glucokinase